MNPARVIPLRTVGQAPAGRAAAPAAKEPLWRDVVGGVLRRERLAQGRTLQGVADAARISMPYLSELERGRKEASSEVLAAAAQALGLGLGDLLLLAQDDVLRRARAADRVTRPGTATPPIRSIGSRIAPARSQGSGRSAHRGEVRLAA